MLTTQISAEESRRNQRIPMQLPIKVDVRVDQKVKWEEISRIRDVSTFGVGLVLSRPLKRGRLIFMTIPMPRKLRLYDLSEPQYKIWGVVRRCIAIKEPISNAEKYSIGVAFIGSKPPENFLEEPATVYEITTRDENDFWKIREAEITADDRDLPREIRRHSRIKLPTNVTVEILDDDGNPVAKEQTVTENISYSGAAIYTTFSPRVGDFVRISSDQYNVSIISIIRGVRIGADEIQRLHLEFIDRFFPLEGII